jgi:cytidylate kinase
VFFTAPLSVRSERISRRENKPLNIVEKEVLERGKSEARRYQELHGININDLEIYDLIIKTNSFHAESVTQIILTAIEVI